MDPIQKIATRKALERVLFNAQHRGAILGFTTKLAKELTSVLDSMQERGHLPTNISTEIEIKPNESLQEMLEEAQVIADLESQLEDEDEPREGFYRDPSTGFRSAWKDSQLDGSNPISPISGEPMEYLHDEDFNPFRRVEGMEDDNIEGHWDVDDLFSFDIIAKSEDIQEIIKEIIERYDDSLTKINYDIDESMAALNRDFSKAATEALSLQYNTRLPIPQLWESALRALEEPDHEDNFFRIKGCFYALAKAYGVIDDFDFDVIYDDEHPNRLSVEFDVIESEDKEYGEIDYKPAGLSIANDATKLEQTIVRILISEMEARDYISKDAITLFRRTLEKVHNRFSLNELLLDCVGKSPDPLDQMKASIKNVEKFIKARLD